MVSLTALESEVLGEMAWDSYYLGELICFVRDASQPTDQYDLYQAVVGVLQSWIGRGWLMLAKRPSQPHFLSSIDQLLAYLEQFGPVALESESAIPLPEVELTVKAYWDVEWLRGLV